VFSNLFSITLPNIGKYFPGIHFPRNLLSKKKLLSSKQTGSKKVWGTVVLKSLEAKSGDLTDSSGDGRVFGGPLGYHWTWELWGFLGAHWGISELGNCEGFWGPIGESVNLGIISFLATWMMQTEAKMENPQKNYLQKIKKRAMRKSVDSRVVEANCKWVRDYSKHQF